MWCLGGAETKWQEGENIWSRNWSVPPFFLSNILLPHTHCFVCLITGFETVWRKRKILHPFRWSQWDEAWALVLHGRGVRAPSKGGFEEKSFASLPLSFSFTRWGRETRMLLLTSGDTSSLSCLSYEDPSSLCVKWIHSGFGGGRRGVVEGVDSFSLHFRPGISHKIKKRMRFPVQPQLITQQPRDRCFCLGTLEGNPIHCTQLRITSGTGQASGFSFQTIVSLKPFPLTLIFLYILLSLDCTNVVLSSFVTKCKFNLLLILVASSFPITWLSPPLSFHLSFISFSLYFPLSYVLYVPSLVSA